MTGCDFPTSEYMGRFCKGRVLLNPSFVENETQFIDSVGPITGHGAEEL